ncbi:deoxyribonuclease II family protein [Sulfuritalea hydrogenivorans]|uniref:Deoxyribonuclease II n=1 Tax=Sulfuritalea hydrogenivorans sk43H TaxID=1223802 RepID=W0SC48_9PROT|nr:deoxyribonuclease II family protein [Sulfuritalea hydrogenivorans]BAO28305.1 deoxyribonuclease II [Sulfuritalea hydrogenivorans sk43H]
MQDKNRKSRFSSALYTAVLFAGLAAFSVIPGSQAFAQTATAPTPLLEKDHAVDWWFVFKFNAKSFPGCGAGDSDQRACPFGGDVQNYALGQQYVYASSETQTLRKGGGCAGTTAADPLGATFDAVYNGSFYYVIWNDQFYNDPPIAGCSTVCSSPWGHSKGMVAWNDAGDGLVLQVSTPSWPAAGSRRFPRKADGNTLGCVTDNDVKVSQHFFSLKVTKDDLVNILEALANASVVTDPENSQIVRNGGPEDIQALVKNLGTKTKGTSITRVRLSTGVGLLSKPSALHVPPWQMVSAVLGGASLRTATWWANPQIDSTTASTPVACWDTNLGAPGAVEIATTGQWEGTTFGLKGGPGPDFNHAKIGVSTAGPNNFAIFGDMNQQGTLSGANCGSSQNGRGGLFYVVENKVLSDEIAKLIKGDTAPTQAPAE